MRSVQGLFWIFVSCVKKPVFVDLCAVNFNIFMRVSLGQIQGVVVYNVFCHSDD